MYTLWIANKNYSSWSLRPWVLMRALGIPFDEKLVFFGTGVDFRTISPTGKVPVLVDGATTVWDSLAIAEYLAERHPGVWPADPVARAWARSAAAEMHSGFATLRRVCSMTVGVRVALKDDVPADLGRDVARLAALWGEGLSRFGGPFLAGPAFTAVDAFYCPVAYRVRTYGLSLPEPAAAYAARLTELPAMRAWEADALAETIRDAEHDAEIAHWGRIVEDRRAPAARS
jgi:glutathione S-transferase